MQMNDFLRGRSKAPQRKGVLGDTRAEERSRSQRSGQDQRSGCSWGAQVALCSFAHSGFRGGQVRAGVELALPAPWCSLTPAWRALPTGPMESSSALTLPLGPQLGHIPSLASVYPLGMGGRKAEQTPWCLGPLRTSQGGNQSVLLPAFITKATERGGTEVMGRVAQSPGLGEELVIPGVVMATGELMWNCGVPMETGLVTMGIPEGNSWFP